jgi:photosystem II stability/assembly factor-like uncharacterized protein
VTVPYAVVFWDARDGLLGTGACPTAVAGTCRRGAVELTTDGGRSYRTVFRARRPVIELQTAGRRAAVARTDGGGSYLTLDGGRSWKPWPYSGTASFATPRIGLRSRSVVTDNHLALALLATRNGGRTWQRRPSPCAQAVAFGALVDLVTPQLGWLVCLGQPGAGNQEKAVFRTRDGGATWRPAGGRIDSYGYPEGIAVAADGFGLLWESRGTLYATRDGGAHWQAEPRVARREIDFGRGAAAFPGGIGFVLLGHGGGLSARLLETRDGGRRWSVVRYWMS